MNKVIYAKDSLFKKQNIENHDEFYLALAVSRCLGELGYCLSIKGIEISKKGDFIDDNAKKYFNYVVKKGLIVLGDSPKEEEEIKELSRDDCPIFSDISFYKDVPLYEEEINERVWKYSCSFNYGPGRRDYVNINYLGSSLFHTVAYHIAQVITNKTDKPLRVVLENNQSKSVEIYIAIQSILISIPWLNDYVQLDLDLEGFNLDIVYLIFCNNQKYAKHYRNYDVIEKRKLIEEYNIVPGTIMVLWSRDKINDHNNFGRLTGSRLIKIEGIENNSVRVKRIAISKTKEEVKDDYNNIDESCKHMFKDLLNFKIHEKYDNLSLYDLGILDHFSTEKDFITFLDQYEQVTKIVTVNTGQEMSIKMSGIDAIYWMLCQYNIDFDKDLFKRTYYFNGEQPLYEKIGLQE